MDRGEGGGEEKTGSGGQGKTRGGAARARSGWRARAFARRAGRREASHCAHLQLLHGRERERDDRVVIVGGLVDEEAVRVLLLLGLDVSHGRLGSECGSEPARARGGGIHTKATRAGVTQRSDYFGRAPAAAAWGQNGERKPGARATRRVGGRMRRRAPRAERQFGRAAGRTGGAASARGEPSYYFRERGGDPPCARHRGVAARSMSCHFVGSRQTGSLDALRRPTASAQPRAEIVPAGAGGWRWGSCETVLSVDRGRKKK